MESVVAETLQNVMGLFIQPLMRGLIIQSILGEYMTDLSSGQGVFGGSYLFFLASSSSVCLNVNSSS